MTTNVKFKLGGVVYELTFDEKDEIETLHKAITLANPPRICDVCNATDVYFTSNKDKEGNTYVNVKCKCGARAKLGRYKVGGFFWHRFEVYQPVKKVDEDKEALDQAVDEMPI